MRKMDKKSIFLRVLLYLFLILVALTVIFPFIWVFSNAFRANDEIGAFTDLSLYTFIPKSPTVDNFIRMFEQLPMLRIICNTVLVAAAVTVISLFINSLTAYAFARINFKGKNIVFFVILSMLVIPIEILIIPLYLIIVKLKLIDTGTWDYTTKPAVQMALEGYTIASNGGTVTLDDMPFADGGIDKELYEDIGKMFSKIDERRSYLDGDFLKHTAIFHSLVTKDMYFEGKECFIAPIVGAYRMCKEMGCPAEFVFDENLKLEKLKDYSVVLMPSVAVLSEEHAEMLQSYLREGGLVVAAGEFAAYEEKKDRLVDSDVLEKLTGLKREGLSDYTLSYFKLEENAYANHISHRPITVRSRYVKYQGANASEIKAWVINPICETTEKVFFHNNIPSPYERTDYPAVLSIPVGKGTLVLFAQDIFAQFSRYHQLEIKKVMENILTVHQKTPKVRFSCASNVETAVSIKDGKMILQLVNFNPGMTVCTGQMDCFEAKYPRTFEFVESIQKLHDIEIIMDYPVERAYAVEQNKELEIKRTDTETKIVLDVLSEWETIVVDLK